MAYVIGIDASTTATKAVLIDETGVVRGVGVTEYGYEVPRPLWSEQSPEPVVGRGGRVDPVGPGVDRRDRARTSSRSA